MDVRRTRYKAKQGSFSSKTVFLKSKLTIKQISCIWKDAFEYNKLYTNIENVRLIRCNSVIAKHSRNAKFQSVFYLFKIEHATK